MTWASRPTTTRPCIEFGSHGPFETGLGRKASPRLAKKGCFFMAAEHDGFPPACHRPRKRTIQYAVTYRLDRAALEYWMPAFAGMTTELRKYASIRRERQHRSR